MRPLFFSLILAAGMAHAAPAQSFKAINRLLVVPLNAADFEVIEARGEGARGMWCAAADYAIARGISRSARLYIKTPRGASVSGAGRIGAVFTLDESRLSSAPFQSYSVSVTAVGEDLPIHHAYQFCKDYLLERDDFLFNRRRLLD
ncbi:MAG: hypothetical protein HKN30_13515 [Sulfitobacter sp.]|nr:hypothetical protein [Sulfitobacter sp.]